MRCHSIQKNLLIMKELIIALMVTVVGFTVNAQEFNLGLSAATPLGEAKIYITLILY